MTPVFKYPGTLLAVLAVLIYFAVRLYYSKDAIGGGYGRILFSLRLAILILISIFAFDPELVREEQRNISLKTLVLFDNSRSVGLGANSDHALIQELSSLSLQNEDLVPFLFGSGFRPLLSADSLNNSDNFTLVSGRDMSDGIEKFSSAPGASSIVLVTDGNFNDADNFSLKQKLPVDVIYTSPPPDEGDVFISDIIYSENPSAEDDKKAGAVVGFRGFTGEKEFVLNVLEKGKVIRTVKGQIPAQNSFINIPVGLPPMDADFREIEFSIIPLANETNVYNNKRTVFQRKTVSSENLLIVSSSQSLDLSFFAKLLKENGYSYEIITAKEAENFQNTGKYSALASFGLPDKDSKEGFYRLASTFSSKLFFTGKKTDLAKLDAMLGTRLNNFGYAPAEAKIFSGPEGEGGFLFRRDDDFIDISNAAGTVLNSVLIPGNREYKALLGYEGISGSQAAYLLTGNGNTVIINASQIWKPLFNDRNGDFGKLMLNLTDLVLSDPNAERIRISPLKQEYLAGEKIVFKGKIFDANMREIKNGTATLTINDQGPVTPFVYDGRNYSAEIYLTEPQIYSASVAVKYAGGAETKKNISFSVKENDSETSVLGSDTIFVKNFASVRNGKAVPLSEGKKFLNEKIGKTSIVTEKKVLRISRTFIFFALMILTFLLEIAIRKYKDLS